MPDDRRGVFVVDASVAAKVWFEEEDSQLARDMLLQAQLLAPDFLKIEISSVAAKRVRRGLTSDKSAVRAIHEVGELVEKFVPAVRFAPRAYELARDNGVSVYDGLYLALAEDEETAVITADARLVAKVRAAGISHLVRPLSESDPSSQT